MSKKISPRIPELAAVVLTLVLSGCATRYRFEVDAITHLERRNSPPTYRLVTAPASANSEAVDAAARRYIATALSSRGMVPAQPGTEPEVEVVFDFSIEGPVSALRTRKEPAYVMMLGDAVAGERVVTYQTRTFHKSLRLSAREVAGSVRELAHRELWSVAVSNNDASDDTEKSLRLMVAAAMDLIGENTATARGVALTESDGRLKFLQADRR